MAIFTPGSVVGQISGRIGAAVYSHNKGGPYIRNGTIPVVSTTPAALAAKQRLGNLSAGWNSLTAGQRLAWKEWANQNPVINRLGKAITLTGLPAYNMLNTRLLAAGLAAIDDPPIVVSPQGMTSLTSTFDIGSGTFALTFAPTPLGATEYLWIKAAVTNSASINYVGNLLRFVGVSAAAQATGFDPQSLIEARFGTLVAGQYVHMEVSVFDGATGLISPPLRVDGVVTDTP